MAKYFECHAESIRSKLQQKRFGRNGSRNGSDGGVSVLELGSGNGLLSVCMLAMARDLLSELVVTDMDDHLALIRKTFDENKHIPQDNVLVMEHKWGVFSSDNNNNNNNNNNDDGDDPVSRETQLARTDAMHDRVRTGTRTFDLILGSDVAYHEDLYDVLIESLLRFSHSHTISLIGITMKDTKPEFFGKLIDAGFKYDRLADHLIPTEFRGQIFGIFAIQRA